MIYFSLKIIHAVSAAILLGGGLFLMLYCVWAYFQKNNIIMQNALQFTLKMNISVIALIGFFQLLSGFALIYLKVTYFSTHWITGVLISYGAAVLCWLMGLRMLVLCQHSVTSASLHRYFWIWLILCLIAMASVMMLYLLMTEPALP